MVSFCLAIVTKNAMSQVDCVRVLRRMNKGKAGGLRADYLNLFIKLGRYQKRGKRLNIPTSTSNWHCSSQIVNGNIPATQIGKILCTTYTLQRDEYDLFKLRHLGVPSALRCILLLFYSYLRTADVLHGIYCLLTIMQWESIEALMSASQETPHPKTG